jgi:hypothetical protein
VSCSNSNTIFNSEQRCGDERNPATPDGNNEKASPHQKQKKPRHAVKVDTAAKQKIDLRMFYLHNNSINPSDVFLKEIVNMVVISFRKLSENDANIQNRILKSVKVFQQL